MPGFGLSNARAEASRKNGARSRGPKTANGKARSAKNALKHGFRAQKYVVLPDEDAAEFAALEAALMDELAPDGVLQTVLARRIAAAVWRLSRAERLEAELFEENGLPGGSLGLALIRDRRRAGAFDTLVRYRGGALAEFWRALRTLKALQAETRTDAMGEAPALAAQPKEPKRRRDPGNSAGDPVAQSSKPDPAPAWLPPGLLPTPPSVPAPPFLVADQGRSVLLAGTALALGRCGL